MPFEIVRNDIVNMQVDAIVNTANPRPVIGSGTDAAIHRKAGPRLLAARERIGTIAVGEARITPAFGLPAKYVIHTVGPRWVDGSHAETELLRRCYANSLSLARKHRLRSVAFPLISTGNYGFPKQHALQVAVEAIREFLRENEMQVFLVVFDRQSFVLSSQLTSRIRSFIDERYARDRSAREYGFFSGQIGETRQVRESYEPQTQPISMDFPECEAAKPAPPKAKRKTMSSIGLFDLAELKKKVKAADCGFGERLLQLIDASGKTDADIYKKANVDRKLFSKIRKNPNYKPSKATALAFAIALELDLDETKDLLGRAGYALSGSSTFDIIVEYFIIHGHYDIMEINLTLFEFDQPLLGASNVA